MLAKPDGGRLREGPQWAYEYKLDGYRVAMRIAAAGTTVLTSRNGLDLTAEFAELTGVLRGRAAVLDGEVVVYNESGQIDFGLLQQRRGRFQKHRTARRDDPFTDVPVRFLVFDLLQLDDELLLNQPYEQRRRLLTELPMPDPFHVAVVPSFSAVELAAERLTPQRLLERVAAEGHEGLVAKRLDSPYLPGKRPDFWCKHPLVQTREVIVCGWRPGQSGFTGTVGGLLLGAHDPDTGDLVYIGDVGTGFTRQERDLLRDRLHPLERRSHPFATTPPREDVVRARWVAPVLVGEVRFRQFTRGEGGRLRHTAWRGLRADREPGEVTAPEPGRPTPRPAPPATTVTAGTRPATPPATTSRATAEAGGHPTPQPATIRRPATRAGNPTPQPPTTSQPTTQPGRPTPQPLPPEVADRVTVKAGGRTLTLSNLDKPLYPDGTAKSEVIAYYTRIAPFLLPHLRDRPVTFVRFPDGVRGQKFFQKNTDAGAPSWLPTVPLRGGGSRRGSDEIVRYPLIHELAALVWAANLAALELHVPQWTVTGGTRNLPDRLVFDLDPGPGTTVVDCCRVAERLHDVLAGDGLTPVATTSGSKGMQVYAGIDAPAAQSPSAYAKAVAVAFERETPDLVTATMAKARREGRVFIDWSQNNPAKTTITPYSLRGRDEPTAATPVTWDEVRRCRRPEQLTFTADNVLDRVAEVGDLFAPIEQRRAPLAG
ncbi:DNA ligase D [Lentzea aerocolonigenes]|uniref:DNA ligase D n=1 Tax=Lentzea aerocolonigenes TaxID=68170 RepID=UPI0009DCC388|nr:DNA ligase D [Lentzea aerocolonigenes]